MLLVSPWMSPIILPDVIPCITPLKEFRYSSYKTAFQEAQVLFEAHAAGGLALGPAGAESEIKDTGCACSALHVQRAVAQFPLKSIYVEGSHLQLGP